MAHVISKQYSFKTQLVIACQHMPLGMVHAPACKDAQYLRQDLDWAEVSGAWKNAEILNVRDVSPLF